MGGRTVYEGHGITPDVKVDRDPYATVAFFADYHMQHKADAAMFQIDTILKEVKEK